MPSSRQKNGIRRSPSGFYSFRKQVPEKLRHLWGKREVKVKLETKDEAVALARGAEVLADFNATKLKLSKVLQGASDLTPSEVLSIADTKVRSWGLHPEQRPKLHAGYSQEEFTAFKEAERTYLERQEIYLGLAADSMIDENQQRKDYESGAWVRTGYKTPYKRIDASTISGATYNVVTGQVATTREPTVEDALNSYIENYKERNYGGNRRTIQSQITNTKRVMTQFASFIESGSSSKGLKRLVTSITVEDALGFRDHLRKKHPGSATGDNNLRYPSSVFAHIIEKGQGLYIGNHLMRNPFFKLRNKRREQDLTQKQWPLTPEEFKRYEAAALEADEHIKLLVLFLLYTGCRISDAYGLEVQDVNIHEEVPTMYLRHNSIRRLDKDGLTANIPIVGPLLEALKKYDAPKDRSAPLLPQFANLKSGRDKASRLANDVRRKAGITRKGVTAHSARHTWQDRLDAARVPISERDYLLAHKTSQSSAVAQGYGSAYPATTMQRNQLAALACTSWGDFRS
ncbi:tyrosine-type recombinase/integrase [Phaeobacter gallaeciensis]|uniref:Tyrosine-type recombinase/integrase n=1 Tax=Phaeobacter gallaeciensis TaxID=60890 RepID=A0ABD4XAA0_9RHOB|nr:tyrosine-type recombinase/integrase [Phaeobacter gallaeciensis]MDE4145236.1 tyrosine-type recombinase/integrase [Phaeobacter gallaeciensis]MDE4157908.1 tyrosine-type recombinase/integrase [Phaeobacter gallaeciensis]MDE4162087.1 tyrosine-type recombinase/integrase [Phaeobacter gallaeciensis]MDE4166311.1 tyrosine-type recombinase/integrase [Phaeobacter gallaeciensis]MDE4170745.1 tyrosine-type recombinase/integrase [Phaeobacter gallaeciensis]